MKELSKDTYDEIYRQLGLHENEVDLISSMDNISFEFSFNFNDMYACNFVGNSLPQRNNCNSISIVKTTRKGNGFTGTTRSYDEDITSLILELVIGLRKINTPKEMTEYVILRNGIYWTDKISSEENTKNLIKYYIDEGDTDGIFTYRKMTECDYEQYNSTKGV